MELDGINDIISSLTPEEAENLKATAQSLISNQDMPVGLGGDSDMKLIMRAKEIMNKMNSQSSNEIRLITALEPYLDDGRRQRANDVKRILRLASMLPLLKELFYDSQ